MTGRILHLGLGAFHRAHQADFTQGANDATGQRWRIEPVAMRNPALAHQLNAQGGRFSLIIRHPEGPQVCQITCIDRAHALPDDPGAVIARFADPGVHVVTVTVTEKGYCLGPDGGPNWSDPVVAHDLAHPRAPRGLLGLVTAGLDARRAAGAGGLTLMSCDNLADNGRRFGAVVLGFAGRRDPGLAGWIAQTCTFPSSMVDRITPAATPDTLALAQAALGRPDPAAVETEPFRQWVIEDHFAGPRPGWEAAGARIVADVRPYEAAKLRMLNGAHSFAAYAGALLGLDAVREVMAHPALGPAIRAHMAQAATSLDPIPGFDLAGYADDLAARFANPAIAHRCLQIAMDGSQKMPQRILQPARALIDRGLPFDACALAIAVWLRFLDGCDERGAPLPLTDPLADRLRAAMAQTGDPGAAVAAVLGPEAQALWALPDWADAVSAALRQIRMLGLDAVLRDRAGPDGVST